MDDSVIKVLRRNGSWENSTRNSSHLGQEKVKNVERENDFILDQKFGILAQEIKKRMKIKSKHVTDNSSSKDLNIVNKDSLEDKKLNIKRIKDVKTKLLPYLLDIQELLEQKALLDNKMSEIDKKLVRIKSIILREKQEYEEEIKAMKKNVDFFDDSLEILNGIKGN